MDYSLLLGVEKVSDHNRNFDTFDNVHKLGKKYTDNFLFDVKAFDMEDDRT